MQVVSGTTGCCWGPVTCVGPQEGSLLALPATGRVELRGFFFLRRRWFPNLTDLSYLIPLWTLSTHSGKGEKLRQGKTKRRLWLGHEFMFSWVPWETVGGPTVAGASKPKLGMGQKRFWKNTHDWGMTPNTVGSFCVIKLPPASQSQPEESFGFRQEMG